MNSVWIIEVWNRRRKKWVPATGASFDSERAVELIIPLWNLENPTARYRPAKYVRKEKA